MTIRAPGGDLCARLPEGERAQTWFFNSFDSTAETAGSEGIFRCTKVLLFTYENLVIQLKGSPGLHFPRCGKLTLEQVDWGVYVGHAEILAQTRMPCCRSLIHGIGHIAIGKMPGRPAAQL
jgi:hypothetical protein